MRKKIVWIVMLALLCGCLPQAFAMGELIFVTKQTQAKLGLRFTLEAERVDSEAVLVRMEIPKLGKLKLLRSISMTVYANKNNLSGRPQVAAPLHIAENKDGSRVVTFQLAPDLADRCTIDLIEPHSGLTYVVYAVELKGYVTERKRVGRRPGRDNSVAARRVPAKPRMRLASDQ